MKRASKLTLLAGLLATLSVALAAEHSPTEKLQPQLDEAAKTISAKTTPENVALEKKSFEKMRDSQVMKTALKEGQTMPSFKLKDPAGKPVDSSALLKSGPLVVVFYRGSWCPFCNLELHALQKRMSEIRSMNGDLVAISAQKPDAGAAMIQKENLDFHVVSDPHMVVAKKFGVAYKVPDEIKQLYLSFGNDLSKENGNKDWELPLTATYVVDRDGKVTYAHVDPDYTKRAEPDDVVAALKKLPATAAR